MLNNINRIFSISNMHTILFQKLVLNRHAIHLWWDDVTGVTQLLGCHCNNSTSILVTAIFTGQ